MNEASLRADGVKVSPRACGSNNCFLHSQLLPHILTRALKCQWKKLFMGENLARVSKKL